MRHKQPEALREIAHQCFINTERHLKESSIVLPFPASSDLPWPVRTMQRPRDSAGGAWKVTSGDYEGLAVIASVELREGALWYHVSLSREGKNPSYKDMCWVKENWMGDRWAIQCFVPAEEHVNVHPHCLHLWHCMTGARPFPNFNVLGHI